MKSATEGRIPPRISSRIKERRERVEHVISAAAPLQPSPAKHEKVTKPFPVSASTHNKKRQPSPTKQEKVTMPFPVSASTHNKKRKVESKSPKPKSLSVSSPKSTIGRKSPPSPSPRPPYPLHRQGEVPSFSRGMESVVKILRSCRNIAVLTGAGISVSCGIPDFRSKDGLYSVMDWEGLGLSCPEELFDWEFFQSNPRPFFQFSKKLYFPLENNQRVRPSDSHKLLRLLQDQKQLLRVYSQNIDGLEEEAGVTSKKVVYAHGSLKWATCLKCKRRVASDELEDSILNGDVPFCQAPSRSSSTPKSPSKPIVRREPSARQRSRQLGGEYGRAGSISFDRQSSSSSSDSSTATCGGVLKPNVTFFGQVLPDNVSRCLESDRKKVDALIVIGTSLSVAPISKVVGYLPPNIPRILINRTIVHPQTTFADLDNEDPTEEPDFRKDYVFDAYLLGNCDDVIRTLVKHLRIHNFARDDDPSESAQSSDDLEETGRLLSEVREGKNVLDEDNEALYQVQDWETATVPAERVFLFPGAEPSTPSTEESVVKLQEVCHCNACSKRIQKGHIHKCLQCFDFDLCATCFPSVAKEHYDGMHQFGVEVVKPVKSR